MGEPNPLVWVIVGCEVGFWVLLGLGLAARYLLRLRRLSTLLLLGVPLLDLVLIGASALDLARGTPVSAVHGLAALYLGFTVGFGHSVIHWADVRVAHRFAGGPPPAPKQSGARHEWREFRKVAVMAVVSLGAGPIWSSTKEKASA
jgi:hypothetical protein